MYHRYLGNLDDESRLRTWASERGIGFHTSWAYFMPLEKVLAYAYQDERYGQITANDFKILTRLALPFDEALTIASRHRQQDCKLLKNQIVMDINGDVVLCCSVYNQKKYSVGNFLERPSPKLPVTSTNSTSAKISVMPALKRAYTSMPHTTPPNLTRRP